MQQRSFKLDPHSSGATQESLPGPRLAADLKSAAELVDYALDGSIPQIEKRYKPPKSRLVTTDLGRTVIHFRDGPKLLEISPYGEPFVQEGPNSSTLFEQIDSLVGAGKADEVTAKLWTDLLAFTKAKLIRAEAFLVLHMPCRAAADIKLAIPQLELMKEGMPKSLQTPEYIRCCEDAFHKDLWAQLELLIAQRDFTTAIEFAEDCERRLRGWCLNELNIEASDTNLVRFRLIKGLLERSDHRIQKSPHDFLIPSSETWVEPLKPPETPGLDIRSRLKTIHDTVMPHRGCLLAPVTSGFFLLPISGDVLEYSLDTDRVDFDKIREGYYGDSLPREVGIAFVEQATLYAERAILLLPDNLENEQDQEQLRLSNLDIKAAEHRFAFMVNSNVEENEARMAYAGYSTLIKDFIVSQSQLIFQSGKVPEAIELLSEKIKFFYTLRMSCPFAELRRDLIPPWKELQEQLYKISDELTDDSIATLTLKRDAAVFREKFILASEITDKLTRIMKDSKP